MFLLILLCLAAPALADIGVLIPRDGEEPDARVLTLDETRIAVRLDHQYARVQIIQIFRNHTNRIEEGKYVFAIPGDSAISDFAVWDGVVRIPGVILERKRASEIYEQLKMQEIDPGLLQQEEGAEEGGRMAAAFSARIVPIPPYGTKRLEVTYTQKLDIQGGKTYFSLPLKPDLFRAQKAGSVQLSLEALSDAPIADFRTTADSYPLTLETQTPQAIRGSFQGTNIFLTEDFAVQYSLGEPDSRLYFLPYRSASLRAAGQPVTAFEKPGEKKADDGYFWASALIRQAEQPKLSPRSLLILLDTSSSMRWEKLEQSYSALEYFLNHLTGQDEFQLVLFNQEVQPATPAPVAASRSNIDSALKFVKSQYLMGGTDFSRMLDAAFAAPAALKNRERYMILITDGNPTLTQLQTRQLLKRFEDGNRTANFRGFCFGIGTDTNRTLLSEIADKSNGLFQWATEGEDLAFKLESFFAKIGQYPVTGMELSASRADLLYQVYPAEPAQVYEGSALDWFGRYRQPATDVVLSARGNSRAASLALEQKVNFPEEDATHEFIPRGWARRRVDMLLRKIELEGEDQASIDEIIALSKKYKFVTPYTSFLAAPRSLLRPRVIRPGDPILRVRTDRDINSVVVIFPFGLVKQLQYLPDEDIWQTRFLVPKEMQDGTYQCRLILRDRSGNQYQENKSFLVDSKPPVFRARWEGRFERGKTVKIVVAADSDTRTLFAGLHGAPAVRLNWNPSDKASVGMLKVPTDLAPGVYEFQVVGEDFAHNQTRWTRKVEVF